MKNLVRLIIIGTLICPLAGIAISCSEEADCSMAARAMVQCYIYTLDEEQTVVNDTLDSLTVTAYGTDSVIINNQKKVHDISLPLQYTTDSTKLVFRYSKTQTDTVIIRHTNTPYFLSMDCGFQMKQSITSVQSSYHRLDSFYVSSYEADINGKENIKLFY